MAKRKAGDYAPEPANKKGKSTAVGAAAVTGERIYAGHYCVEC